MNSEGWIGVEIAAKKDFNILIIAVMVYNNRLVLFRR